MKSILIIGDKGSMGRRYAANLRYLDFPRIDGVDNDASIDDIAKVSHLYDGIILATPTNTHFEILMALKNTSASVLCEKPITKSREELDHVLYAYKDKNLQMVMQYKDLETYGKGDSFYDYYNHGRDGLYWDCLQIIALAQGRVMLSENSPFWKCRLNGTDLDISKMDIAYNLMLRRWMRNPRGDYAYLKDVHEKVMEYAKNAS